MIVLIMSALQPISPRSHFDVERAPPCLTVRVFLITTLALAGIALFTMGMKGEALGLSDPTKLYYCFGGLALMTSTILLKCTTTKTWLITTLAFLAIIFVTAAVIKKNPYDLFLGAGLGAAALLTYLLQPKPKVFNINVEFQANNAPSWLVDTEKLDFKKFEEEARRTHAQHGDKVHFCLDFEPQRWVEHHNLKKGVCTGMSQLFIKNYFIFKSTTTAACLQIAGANERALSLHYLHVTSWIEWPAFAKHYNEDFAFGIRHFLGHYRLGAKKVEQVKTLRLEDSALFPPNTFSDLPEGAFEVLLNDDSGKGHSVVYIKERDREYIFDPNFGLIPSKRAHLDYFELMVAQYPIWTFLQVTY